jgi:hypothetical protein
MQLDGIFYENHVQGFAACSIFAAISQIFFNENPHLPGVSLAPFYN